MEKRFFTRYAIVLFLVVSGLIVKDVSAEKKCKYTLNKADEFSGKVTKSTTATLAKSWKIYFSKADTVYSLSLYVLLPGEINTAINQGDSLFLKLKNNEIIRLVAANIVPPRTYVAGAGAYASVVSDFTPMYGCTKEDMEKLSLQPLTVIRVFIGQQFMELAIKEKNSKNISEAAGCVLE